MGFFLRSKTTATIATTATTAMMITSRSVLLRPPVEVVVDVLMMIVAGTLLLAPFSVAVTVRITVPAELPAVNVVEEAVAELMLPSGLLRAQLYEIPEVGQVVMLPPATHVGVAEND